MTHIIYSIGVDYFFIKNFKPSIIAAIYKQNFERVIKQFILFRELSAKYSHVDRVQYVISRYSDEV